MPAWIGLAGPVDCVLPAELLDADLPDPHSLALSLSCAVVPPPALGGGEGSAGPPPDSALW